MKFHTSGTSSETRSTVEYILTIKTGNTNDIVDTMSLGIVDTPGADDTNGIEQDARNVVSIKKFLDGHESLKGKNKWPTFLCSGCDFFLFLFVR